MTVAVAFTPVSPVGGDAVLITITEDVGAGLEGPATCKVTRDSDSQIVARSVPFGIGEAFGYTDATSSLAIDATGGTYTLTVDGHTTAGIAFNAIASAIEAAITAAVGADVVGVSGTGPYSLKSKGADLDKAITITASAASLTGGASTATVTPGTIGGVGEFLDSGGPFQFGPLQLPTANYHIDVVDGGEASLLPGGTPVALVVA